MFAELEGQIEKITYTSVETGFTIAKVTVGGHRGLVTVVGNIAAPTVGEIIKMKGEWVNHPRYGEQFKIAHYDTKIPASVYGIGKIPGFRAYQRHRPGDGRADCRKIRQGDS